MGILEFLQSQKRQSKKMEFLQYLSEGNVVTFFLLLLRMSGLVMFFPFFSHMQVPVVIKSAFAFVLTIFLLPFTPVVSTGLSLEYLVLESISELLFGLAAGAMLSICFAALSLAGEQISMVMGFSMANVMDPQTGVQSPLISNVLTLIVLTAFLIADGHHIILQFMAKSVSLLELGSFYPSQNIWSYASKSVVNMFLFGFITSFPILALSLMSDFIFGMLMKTMPQFNLLVVGFPIKIIVAFVVLIATIAAIVKLFVVLLTRVLNDLPFLFF